ncbi:branched-chain amino acid ABC transporter permease [Nocardioides sp. B-3]|uniref:branched-chain amino acid ABC transporter permease n=1 Tax=Nocardioides sp. B-3 TaxID=2895565 RepID=UPI002152176E|nr:hypothetical protein [Nocardioides sp. B-3]UUZ58520.1 hypothetical protein LP418_20470 [Nocardioides sp. B-3]
MTRATSRTATSSSSTAPRTCSPPPDGTRFSSAFIENKLKFSPYVEEAVAFGTTDITAMITIDPATVGSWAEHERLGYTTYTDLAGNDQVAELLKQEVHRANAELPESIKVKHFPGALQAARPRRRRDHPHPQGPPQRHQRALRRPHRGARPRRRPREHDQHRLLPGRHLDQAGHHPRHPPPGGIRAPATQQAAPGLEWSAMSNFLTQTIYGVSDGAILALAALGFVLIYKSTGVINFARGEFLLIGAYTVYAAFVVFQLPLVLAVVVGILFAILMGVLIERLILRPLVGENAISVIMVTIGLAAVLKAVAQLFFGTRAVTQPALLPRTTIEFAGATFPLNRIPVIVIAAVVLTLFTLFFQRSRHGIAMRAVADDQQAALTLGISVRRIFAMARALAAVSALIGGVLLGDITEVSSRLTTFGLLVFPVVILGGLDSVPGTIVGGPVIGLSGQYVSSYWDPGPAQIAPYLLLVAILLVRPYGLFGETRIERV